MAEETDFIGLISSFLGPATSDDDVGSVTSAAPAPSDDPSQTVDENFNISPPSTRVIIFSKDRPWQLQQLLRSMKLTIDNSSTNGDENHFIRRVEIFIICRATTSDFADGYELIRQSYQTVVAPCRISFLYEEEAVDSNSKRENVEGKKPFSHLLEHALNASIDANNGNNTPSFVMFLTDDCLLLESLDVVLAHAIGSLQCDNKERVYNFVTRLHPGISRSQTRDCGSPSPRDWQYYSLEPNFTDECGSPTHNNGVYLYTTKRGSIEWNYPFDLSGGVYRYSDVQMIIKQISRKDKESNDQDGLSHPNTFEVRGNQAVLELETKLVAQRRTLSAIPSRPLMIILAINRVQDICQAPIAKCGEGRVTGIELPCENIINDPSTLLKHLQTGRIFDIERYLSTPYNSSHVGDVLLLEQCKYPQSPVVQRTPDISVLIPVHSGVDFASHSIASIIMQYLDGLEDTSRQRTSLTSMQIVIVDDRCMDGSINTMIQSCETLLATYPTVLFEVIDQRSIESTLNGDNHLQHNNIQSEISITINIVSSKFPGVAGALNTGLEHCQSELVARMDADDVSAPRRLITQLRCMRDNPSINVLGTSTVSFSVDDDQKKKHDTLLPYHSAATTGDRCRILRTSLSVMDPGFMSWTMLFSCCIAHPSVMFRKSAIQAIGGYNESIKYTEDYDLWLRLLEKDCRSVLCLPFVGVWHRKHNRSNSVANSLAQKNEANEVCHNAFSPLVGDESESLGIENVSTLRDPSIASSLDAINNAAKLLMKIESSFLQKNAQCLTKHEIELIHDDCNARIGELATIAISRFGEGNANSFKFNNGEVEPCYVWRLWSDRCPDEQFQRLSLLCHLDTIS